MKAAVTDAGFISYPKAWSKITEAWQVSCINKLFTSWAKVKDTTGTNIEPNRVASIPKNDICAKQNKACINVQERFSINDDEENMMTNQFDVHELAMNKVPWCEKKKKEFARWKNEH